jgi:phosphatidylglycerophosphate synthase
MPTAHGVAAMGTFASGALMVWLSEWAGLGPAGWAAGLAYVAAVWIALTRWMRHDGTGLGPADVVTLSRAILIGGVAAVTAESFRRPQPVAVLVVLAAVALVLDAVDGRVARRTGTASSLGARFDGEVDASLLLVLATYVANAGTEPALTAGALAIGGMRYAFGLACWACPWMRRRLPARYWRKVVTAVQGVVLVTAAADVIARPIVGIALAVALALLLESFGRDVLWLWRRRVVQPQLAPDLSLV